MRHYRTCPLCEATCGLEIETAGENIHAIRGDKKDPLSRGYVCAKGRALRTPIKRVGDQWQAISWEEAWGLVAEGLSQVIEKYGRSGLGIYLGNPVVHKPSLYFYTPMLLQAMRSPHIYSASSLDQLPHQLACGLLFFVISSLTKDNQIAIGFIE